MDRKIPKIEETKSLVEDNFTREISRLVSQGSQTLLPYLDRLIELAMDDSEESKDNQDEK